MAEIRVFTTPTCTYCHKVKGWLNEQGCEYTELDITKNVAALREWRSLSGGIGVPVTAHGKDLIIGFDPERLARMKACVENSSTPDPSMLPQDVA
jgi:glutaredoxin 3